MLIAEKCANKSSPPSSGVMKPKPLESLNHLTVPVAIKRTFKLISNHTSYKGKEVSWAPHLLTSYQQVQKYKLISHCWSKKQPKSSAFQSVLPKHPQLWGKCWLLISAIGTPSALDWEKA